jgi:Fic family protein
MRLRAVTLSRRDRLSIPKRRQMVPMRMRRGLRMVREGPDGFVGGLSASKYATIAGTSPATATRDLVERVALGALVRTGERKHTRYQLAIPLRRVALVVLNQHGDWV